jgi:soluble lytic murein transglycosylase-like protein
MTIGDSLRESLTAFRGAFRDEYAAVRQGGAAPDGLDAYAAWRGGAQGADAADPLANYAQSRGGWGAPGDSSGAWDILTSYGQRRGQPDAFSLYGEARSAHAVAEQSRQQAEMAAQVRAQGTLAGGSPDDAEVSPYWGDIQAAARQYGVDADTLAAIIKVESHGRADAVSPAGALGLGQVMPSNFQSGEDWRDPRTNIMVSARVLRQKQDAYGGDPDMAIRGYHGFGSDGITTDTDYLNLVKQNRAQIQQGRQRAAQAGGVTVGADGAVFPVVGWTQPVSLHWGSAEGTGATDIMAPAGSQIVAVRGGQVTYAAYDPTGGWAVMVQGDDGMQYYYAHMQAAPSVQAGQRIGAGVGLGLVGNTGNASTGPAHLHIGIGPRIRTGTGPLGGAGEYPDGRPFDAVSYLNAILRGGGRATTTRPQTGRGTIRY